MGLRAFTLLFASFLMLTTSISSNDQELLEAAVRPLVSVKAPPVPAPPVKPLVPAPPVKPLVPPPSPPPVTAPVPAPPVKQPTPPPPAKSPLPAPPTYKPPTPSLPVPKSPPTPPKNTRDCYPLCVVRCKLHSRRNVCLRACVTCCDRCKCVPPGQYGNREKCGKCYVNMTTHGGRPKCP